MGIYNVTAQSFTRKTGKETAKPRDEQINTEHNELFRRCKCMMDVKRKYESFWNDLNQHSTEVVFVQKIEVIRE